MNYSFPEQSVVSRFLKLRPAQQNLLIMKVTTLIILKLDLFPYSKFRC